jgi:CDGSH-type Zn-finger protein
VAEIVVGENGSYHVTGGVPLVRISKVESEEGEPIAWHVDQTYDVDGEYVLCRCGGSSDKPFCTDDHLTNAFDGSEGAPTDTYEERAKTLGGGIRDDRGICTHAGFCANRITSAWKASKLIDDDPELRAKVVEMIHHCPSGALSIDDEPELPVQIAVQTDGPLLVTGRITVKRADGQPFEVRNRMALCRCGNSKIKPLCDGSHKEVGFTG